MVELPEVTQSLIGNETVQTVNARELHEWLGVGTEFRHWIRRRIEECRLEAGVDYVAVNSDRLEFVEVSQKVDYFLTLRAARKVSMIDRSHRGDEAREYFLDIEESYRDGVRASAVASLDDEDHLRSLLLEAIERSKVQKELLAVQAPKVAVFDRVAESYGSMCITDAAKTIGQSPKVLHRHLIENNWIYRRAGTSVIGYQVKITAGYLVHKVTIIPQDDGTERTFTQVRITPRGMLELAKHFPPPIAPVKKPNGSDKT